MRVAICLRPAVDDWAAASAYVTEAERLGVDVVWLAEAWREDPRRVPDGLVLKTNLVGTEAMVRRRLTTLGRLLDLVRDTRAVGEAAREPILTGAARA